MVLKKCNHNWKIDHECFIYDAYSPLSHCNKIKIIYYKCDKCLRVKKEKLW